MCLLSASGQRQLDWLISGISAAFEQINFFGSMAKAARLPHFKAFCCL
jgi:hypothetical protein